MAHDNSWCGAPTTDGFTVVTEQTGSPTSVTLHVSTASNLSGASTFDMSSTFVGVWKAAATGLTPGTQYFWGVAEDGGAPEQVGSARTAPSGAASFSFWSSSCAATNSNHMVFGAILDHDPDFGLHMGDLHYRDIGTNDPALFHQGFQGVLRTSGQGGLYRNVPTFYVWDDHDYGPNNSNYTSPSRPAAITAYRQRVPHPPLPHSEGAFQTWAYGRIRFLMMDARSLRGKDSGSLLGLEQRQWVKDTLTAASEPVAIISTAVPWIGTLFDNWFGFQAERLELAEWLVDNGWQGRVILVAGDAHSISWDDGSHNPFGDLYAPIFQTAALDQGGSIKGGTYTRPEVLDRGQYGLWEVVDTGGDTLDVRMHAYSLGTTLLYTETVTLPATSRNPAARRGAAAAAFL